MNTCPTCAERVPCPECGEDAYSPAIRLDRLEGHAHGRWQCSRPGCRHSPVPKDERYTVADVTALADTWFRGLHLRNVTAPVQPDEIERRQP